jgi:hypothetical protein
VSHDPQSTLRPLRAAAVDVEALRAGQAGAGAVVRVSRAAETTLRRMLRDDPTAPVELRLRALSPDDLSTPDLLAELRRRDRLPMELAAAFHDLAASASRLAGEGGDATPRDVEAAVAVADGLERHVRSQAFETQLEDPVLDPDETLIPPSPEDADRVHPVPPVSRASPRWPVLAGAAAVLLLVVALLLRGRGADLVEKGEAAYNRRDTAEAGRLFRQAAERDPEAPLPHFYLAQLHRQAGRTAEAVRELQAGLRAAPRDPGLNVELGFLLLDQGKAAQAADRFQAAVTLDPNSRRAWAGLVRALRAAGRPAAAERVLSMAPPAVRALVGGRDTARAADTSAGPR